MLRIERADRSKADLIAQVEIRQTQNRKLRDRLVSLMIKDGEIP
jgi:hypothetical protein